MASITEAGPPTVTTPAEQERAETRRRAALRQAIWEASQTMSLPELRAFADDVLKEIVQSPQQAR